VSKILFTSLLGGGGGGASLTSKLFQQ
jgi:hypothetical protein